MRQAVIGATEPGWLARQHHNADGEVFTRMLRRPRPATTGDTRGSLKKHERLEEVERNDALVNACG